MNVLDIFPEDVFSGFEVPVLNKWKSIEVDCLEPLILHRASSDPNLFEFPYFNFSKSNFQLNQEYEIFPILNFQELFVSEPDEPVKNIEPELGNIEVQELGNDEEDFFNGFNVIEAPVNRDEEAFFNAFNLVEDENQEENDFFGGFNIEEAEVRQRPPRQPRPARPARQPRVQAPQRRAVPAQPQEEAVDYHLLELFSDILSVRLPQELIEEMMQFAFFELIELDPHSIHCKICLAKTSDYQDLDCKHRFCLDCYKMFCESLVGSCKIMPDELKCPECEKLISESTFMRYFTVEEIQRIHNLRFKLKGQALVAQKKAVSCPVPDCPGYAHLLKDEKITACCKCKCSLCAFCGLSVHPGITCEENAKDSQDDEFQKLMLSQNWKKCPTCGVPVEKLDGCQFLYCSSMICKGRNCLCNICGRFVIEEQHFSHYKTKGPFGDTCNTLDGIPEDVDPTKLVPILGDGEVVNNRGGEEE